MRKLQATAGGRRFVCAWLVLSALLGWGCDGGDVVPSADLGRDARAAMGDASRRATDATTQSPSCAGVKYDEFFRRLHAAFPLGADLDRAVAILALVPDPHQPGLAYAHRGFHDAIVLAFEHLGFQLAAQRDPLVTLDAGVGGAHPGFLVFRNAHRRSVDTDTRPVSQGYTPDAVYVLLVAETPEVGPDFFMLHLASCAIASRLPHVPWTTPVAQIVVGPTYSGSSAVLRAALDRFFPGEPIVVVNGSATGAAVREFLAEAPGITLRSTVIPDTELEQQLYQYLVNAGMAHPVETTARGPRDAGAASGDATGPDTAPPAPVTTVSLQSVAMLVESGSGYGAGDLSDPRTQGVVPLDGSSVRYLPELQLSYPLHIASLRTAYLQQDRLRAQAPEAVQGAAFGRTHVLDPNAGEEPEHMMPLVSLDLGLNQMLAESAHEGIRFLGIKATDPADVVFLARRVREVAPDIRLMLLQSDQYFLHPEHRRDLLGTLVVTPYPFLGTNALDLGARDGDREDADWDHHVAFANSAAEGVHNAVTWGTSLLTLDRSARGMLAEYMPFRCRSSDVGAPPRNYLRPLARRLDRLRPPPVWISVLGNTGLTPLAATHGREAVDHPSDWRPRQRRQANPPQRGQRESSDDDRCAVRSDIRIDIDKDVIPPRFTATLLLAFACFALLFVAREWRRYGTFVAAWRAEVGFRWRSYTWFLALESGVLSVMILTLMTLQYIAIDALPKILSGLPLLAFAAGVVANAFIGFPLIVSLHNLRQRSAAPPGAEPIVAKPLSPDDIQDRPWGYVAATLALALLGPVCCIAIVKIVPHVHVPAWAEYISTSRFFALRALPLFNGITPVTPWLFLLTSIFWCAHTRRKRILDLLILWRLSDPQVGHSGGFAEGRALREIFAKGANTPASKRWREVLRALPAAIDEVLERLRFGTLGRRLQRNELQIVAHALNAPEIPEERVLHELQVGFFLSRTHMLVLVLIWAAPFVLVTTFPIQTLELPLIDTALLGALIVSSALGCATVARLVVYWAHLEPLLRRLGNHPVGPAFSSIAPTLADRVEQQLTQRRSDLGRMVVCVNMLQRVIHLKAEVAPAPREWLSQLGDALLSLEAELVRAVDVARADEARDQRSPAALGADVMRLLLAASATCVRALEKNWWRARNRDEELGPVTAAIEAFIASVLSIIVNRFVRPIHWYFIGSAGMAFLMLFALSSYPFRPRNVVLFYSWAAMMTVSAATLSVYIQMDRNTVLSRIARKEPGVTKFSFAFVARIFTFGILPFLSLVAAQFPQVIRLFYDVLTPIARFFR